MLSAFQSVLFYFDLFPTVPIMSTFFVVHFYFWLNTHGGSGSGVLHGRFLP